jgi:hypothetical protein
MESMDEHERFLANPLRLIRCAVELGRLAALRVDDNLFDFPEYNEANYPPIRHTEAPVASEAELSD